MSDPNQPVDLTGLWAQVGLRVNILIFQPRSTKNNNKRKKKNKDGTNPSATGGKNVVNLDGPQPEAEKIEKAVFGNEEDLDSVSRDPPSTESIHSPGGFGRAGGSEGEARCRQRRGGQAKKAAGETSSYRAKTRLGSRHASEAEAREEQLKAQVTELTAANSEQSKQFARASIEGFQMGVNLTATLAPWVNFKYFDGKHVGLEGKTFLGDQVVYDLAKHPST